MEARDLISSPSQSSFFDIKIRYTGVGRLMSTNHIHSPASQQQVNSCIYNKLKFTFYCTLHSTVADMISCTIHSLYVLANTVIMFYNIFYNLVFCM